MYLGSGCTAQKLINLFVCLFIYLFIYFLYKKFAGSSFLRRCAFAGLIVKELADEETLLPWLFSRFRANCFGKKKSEAFSFRNNFFSCTRKRENIVADAFYVMFRRQCFFRLHCTLMELRIKVLSFSQGYGSRLL